MKQDNPFAPVETTNNPEGLIIPWSVYGPLEEQLILERYLRLRNDSYGYIVRYPVR